MTSTTFTFNVYDRVHLKSNRSERGTIVGIDGDIVTVRWDLTGFKTSRHRSELTAIPMQPDVKTTSDSNVFVTDLGIWITTGRNTENGSPIVLINTAEAPADDVYDELPKLAITLNDCDVFADYGEGPETPEWQEGKVSHDLISALANALAATVEEDGTVDALTINDLAALVAEKTSTTVEAFNALVDRRIDDARTEAAR